MTHDTYKYRFDESVPAQELEDTFMLAMLAVESLHGRSRVRMESRFNLDKARRTCVIDASTDVGSDLVNARIVDAGNGRTQGRGARCEHQPVIRLPFAGTAIDVADFHAFVGAVDAYGFAVGAYVEIEHGLQRCRGLDGERVACRDLSADEIG